FYFLTDTKQMSHMIISGKLSPVKRANTSNARNVSFNLLSCVHNPEEGVKPHVPQVHQEFRRSLSQKATLLPILEEASALQWADK
ncbi:jg13751, partial [Pararge aegeria aegeria]